MSKFKIGDRVVVDYSNGSVYSHVKEESGIVLEINDSTYLVKCDNDIDTFKESIFTYYKSDKNDLIWVEDQHLTKLAPN